MLIKTLDEYVGSLVVYNGGLQWSAFAFTHCICLTASITGFSLRFYIKKCDCHKIWNCIFNCQNEFVSFVSFSINYNIKIL